MRNISTAAEIMQKQQNLLPEILYSSKIVFGAQERKTLSQVSSVGWFTVPTYLTLCAEECRGRTRSPFSFIQYCCLLNSTSRCPVLWDPEMKGSIVIGLLGRVYNWYNSNCWDSGRRNQRSGDTCFFASRALRISRNVLEYAKVAS